MKKLKILIAEDEYLVLMGLKSNLKELGHEIIAEAMNGKEAIELAKEKSPDLIIADINMPEIDGIEAVKQINKDQVIPSIIVTGYSDDELIEKASKVGVFAYLVKPVGLEELKASIIIAMNKYEEFKEVNRELKDQKKALENRKLIERAKGILMDTLSLTEAEAMKKLQQKSQEENSKLVEVAKNIIEMNEYLN
ncbi:response regulator receiver and ANTAR domain protein [Halanaerobium saccharolyticum]|uniref:Stage 0 sporulation protein A homolog n=1 Tax=Halanaerobium saccharolyticum TaxID=43595 RepID=A0A4R6LYB9_9FIRM|nr:response regulator [Halanaerobium saccharolyticum]TDO93858.1 response regulator receiver and ANTAR domain protein [Halanaerobium saccharolyticum]